MPTPFSSLLTRRRLRWLAVGLLALPALALVVLVCAFAFGLNWARGPLQDLALQKTGRALRIEGDLRLVWNGMAPRLRGLDVTFANPPWATTPRLLSADAVEFSVELLPLLQGHLVLPEVRLTRPHLYLEQASGGRKSWLLDLAQTDETHRVQAGRVLLDEGEITYLDAAQDTAVFAMLSTHATPTDDDAATPLRFTAGGQFRGQALRATGQGGAVLRVRDVSRPYPLRLEANAGATELHLEGTVTDLARIAGADLQLRVRGDSLASLYPLLGLALPPTPPYRSAGRLTRSGSVWRYASFTARFGSSDATGTLQVDAGGTRPLLTGELAFQRLDLADLKPAVGARARAPSAAPPARVLPDLPFGTAHWAGLDADVALQARAVLRERALPLDDLQGHLVLKDATLSLAPLRFAWAGGKVSADLVLDGRAAPLRGHAKVTLRGVQLGRLLPLGTEGRSQPGLMNGEADLRGTGPSVGSMLASADGHLRVTADKAEISRLLMEQAGLHLLEILRLNLTGDQTVQMNCAVADFEVKQGVMRPRSLVLDTAINTVTGSGSVDLGDEALDLRFVPRTKRASLVALRSPFYVKGSFGKPRVELDAGRIAARGAGALALGLLNPLLALVPLFESGPGTDTDCAQLLRGTPAVERPPAQRPAPSAAPGS